MVRVLHVIRSCTQRSDSKLENCTVMALMHFKFPFVLLPNIHMLWVMQGRGLRFLTRAAVGRSSSRGIAPMAPMARSDIRSQINAPDRQAAQSGAKGALTAVSARGIDPFDAETTAIGSPPTIGSWFGAVADPDTVGALEPESGAIGIPAAQPGAINGGGSEPSRLCR